MRSQSLFSLAFATLVTALPQPQTPDKPIDFVVSIFEKSLTCDASTGAKTVFGTTCQNRIAPANSSALVRVSKINDAVTGFAGADCTGEVVVVFGAHDGCTSFEDVEVKSWKAGTPF